MLRNGRGNGVSTDDYKKYELDDPEIKKNSSKNDIHVLARVSNKLVVVVTLIFSLIGVSTLFFTGGFSGNKNSVISSAFVRQQEEEQSVETFVHDNPNHPWHWTRKNLPGRELSEKKDCGGIVYGDLYRKYHEEGWIVFTSCSLQNNAATIIEPVAEFTKQVEKNRLANAKIKEVKDLALDPDTLEFIEFLHGSTRAFPFQTLNFPKGTQQNLHSDLAHFDTYPRTMMCAAWVALEDTSEDNGPLRFYPKSHQWGTWDPDEIGMPHKYSYDESNYGNAMEVNYGNELEVAMKHSGLNERVASDLKKGQTFIWAAGLVHGGSKQKNRELTRLSQVSHYYFEGSQYYWVPKLSDLTKGRIYYRDGIKPCKKQFVPNIDSEEYHSCADAEMKSFRKGL